jgi:phosphatidylserine decarboxylase
MQLAELWNSANTILGNFWSHGIRKLVKKTNYRRHWKQYVWSILYRQVAGALARRIVNYAEEGMQVVQGTDAGFILVQELICFYLSELQSTLCLIKSRRKTIIATKA